MLSNQWSYSMCTALKPHTQIVIAIAIGIAFAIVIVWLFIFLCFSHCVRFPLFCLNFKWAWVPTAEPLTHINDGMNLLISTSLPWFRNTTYQSQLRQDSCINNFKHPHFAQLYTSHFNTIDCLISRRFWIQCQVFVL